MVLVLVTALGIGCGTCLAEELVHWVRNQGSQVAYDDTGRIQAVISYTKPNYKKTAIMKHRTNRSEVASRINTIKSRRLYN